MDGNLVSAAFAAFEALKALVGERDHQKALAIELDFGKKLMALQTQLVDQLTLLSEQRRVIDELEQDLRAAKAQLAQKQQVNLVKVGSVGQFFAYSDGSGAKAADGSSCSEHFFCQPCFESGKRIVLMGNGSGYWSCPVCSVGAQTEPDGQLITTVRTSSRWEGY